MFHTFSNETSVFLIILIFSLHKTINLNFTARVIHQIYF